ncbi:MAG: hypothetical protein IM620_00450, partial [Cytophagales bacterium]|nr:hypothetical protein [Cytophagales bacterium]
MALPVSRQTFKDYCLRRLGAPVTQINVDDDQVDDRIDDALQYYWDFHFDGTSKTYYKAQITQQDYNNKYITLPENIIGAVHVFPIGSSLSTNNLFNIRYQIALNDLYDLTATTMVPYYMAMQHIQLLEQLLVGQHPIRFNRRMNRLYVDMDWDRLNVGEFVIVEAFQVVDPDTYTKVWSDRWLQKYATELIKQQWGQNLIKFQGVSLPGGMQFN